MAIFVAITASAEPANPTPIVVKQPSGEMLQLKLVGDEFYHFNTTIDGYTILNVNGQWEYATKRGNNLESSGIMAHDPAMRTAQEVQLLENTPKHLIDEQERNTAVKARATRDKKNRQNREPVVDYSTFRGLIILINFNDKQFQMSDANSFYDQLCNTENYTGFYHGGSFHHCTGSVRDYYYDNSMGQFDPEFDVVGPVTLDYSCYEGNNRARDIFKDALDAVDSQVDFTKYDADNDGEIDMVFFMVAGYSSSYSGNNSGYLWPHMSYLYGFSPGEGWYYLEYDGKYMGRYASSCEIYGWESYGYTMPNAIGTICHEFGHVLGLPDLYDTDYSGSGGESNHPGDWDVMASGSSSNYGRTPVGYSLWERWELGFTADPEELTLGTKSLTAINTSNSGFKMSTSSPDEFFLFENRQANKWDAALPGHGLVIARVDYSNQEAWWSNNVNSNPSHNYYELVRASGSGASEVPFPGNHNVTSVNSISYPGSLVTWSGEPCQYGLNGITENNRIITFDVVNDVTPSTIIEDFESIPTGLPANAEDMLGNFATWNFPKANVADNEGSHAASLQMPGGIAMNSDIAIQAFKISLNAINNSSTASRLQLYYSTDEGNTWNSLGTEIALANSTTPLTWRLNLEPQPMRFKINRTSGSKTVDLLIDDLTIHYTDSTLYDLHVAGAQVTGVNMGNLSLIDGVEGLVQYHPISNTLRIEDAVITKSNSMGLSCSIPNLTINLEGENSINSGENGMTLSSNPTINGNGSLFVNSQNNLGMSFNGNCVIEGGVNLSLHGHNLGIFGDDPSSATITVNGAETTLEAIGDNASTISNIYNLILNDGLVITSPAGAYFDNEAHAVVNSDGNAICGEWVKIGKATPLLGDVNGDGHVTSDDITILYNWLLNSDDTNLVNGDQNGDGKINAVDITIIYSILLGN